MVVSQWKLTRMEIAEQSIFLQTEGPKVQIPLLDRLWRCQCRLERSYAQAQRELQKLQRARREPAPAQQQPARSAAVLELQPQDQLQLPGGLVQRRDGGEARLDSLPAKLRHAEIALPDQRLRVV